MLRFVWIGFQKPQVKIRNWILKIAMWDKAALLKDRRAFIDHLQRLESEGCVWLVVPLAEDETSGPFRCSRCQAVAPDAAPFYSLATHIAYEYEVLPVIEASYSDHGI
jgi:hypothetical protein